MRVTLVTITRTRNVLHQECVVLGGTRDEVPAGTPRPRGIPVYLDIASGISNLILPYVKE
ncbi:hypothetical protein PEC302107_37350 [Pectobacterium araliae]|nr:hypothetical protein PEC302107_37350 [Pectobacterium carotovorum subsp. carotovorum]